MKSSSTFSTKKLYAAEAEWCTYVDGKHVMDYFPDVY